MVYVKQVCWQIASRILILLEICQWKTPDDGQRNCPKHVEFYSKNKFKKLVHLVGFIIRKLPIYSICFFYKRLKLVMPSSNASFIIINVFIVIL